MDGFYFNLPAGQQSDVLAIEFSSATPANRGNTIRNIWIQGLQKGFTAGDTFARITIQNWNHLFLETNTVGAISINLPNLSNTTWPAFARSIFATAIAPPWEATREYLPNEVVSDNGTLIPQNYQSQQDVPEIGRAHV